MQQGRRVRLFPRQRIARHDDLENTREAELLEERPGETLRLVGDAGEPQLHRAQALQPFLHARIDQGVTAVDLAVAALVDRERARHQLLRGAAFDVTRQRALDQPGYALADEGADQPDVEPGPS